VKVIDHEHYSWYLFEKDDALFLDVLCNISFAQYSWMIQLNAEEVAEYREQGRYYISRLARDIQYTAPLAKDTTSIYRDRNVSHQYGAEVHQAVAEWGARSEGLLQ
jgi:hypothetical protein